MCLDIFKTHFNFFFTETSAEQTNTTTAEVTVEATADGDKDDKQEEPATLEAASQDQPVCIIFPIN